VKSARNELWQSLSDGFPIQQHASVTIACNLLVDPAVTVRICHRHVTLHSAPELTVSLLLTHSLAYAHTLETVWM
jgi:hypothetical protein